MKPTQEVIQALAGAYVLGTLRGPARRRFERWMMESYRVRQEVWFWENHLGALNENMPSEVPPPWVWQRISQRLWSEPKRARTARWFWPFLGITASVAAVVLAVLLWLPVMAPRHAGMVAVVQGGQSEPLWVLNVQGVLNAQATDRLMRLKAVSASPAAQNKDYELWILPKRGKPVAVGLLPVSGATTQVALNHDQIAALASSERLAISLEPHGGSPTGQPTGPVLYSFRLVRL